MCCSVLQCVAAQHSKCNRPYTNTNSHASVMPIYYTHPHITLFKIVKYKYTYMNTYTLSQDSTLVRYAVLQCVAVCCSVLQCVAVCCSVLQCVAVCCSMLHYVAACCNGLQTLSSHSQQTHIRRIIARGCSGKVWGGFD